MIHKASSPSSNSISTIVCPIFQDNGSLTGLASTSHKRRSKQQKGWQHAWSVNRFSLDVVVMILPSFFSLCLPLQLPFLQDNARTDGANDLTNIHRSPPKTFALSALLLTGPSAAVSQFLRQRSRHSGCRRWVATKGYLDNYPPLGHIVGKEKGS